LFRFSAVDTVFIGSLNELGALKYRLQTPTRCWKPVVEGFRAAKSIQVVLAIKSGARIAELRQLPHRHTDMVHQTILL
jgi:hypothetical protein